MAATLKLAKRTKTSNNRLFKKGHTPFVNSIDPFIPEWWANETLAILEEEMIAAQLVNRDFEKYFASAGDVVNTRRPVELVGVRKWKNENVTTQDVTADNIQVNLDQWNHVSFTIDDLESAMSMKVLQDEYARPAAVALARMVDQSVLMQYPRFLPYMGGKLNGLTSSNVKDYLIDTRQVMDENKAPTGNRNLILSAKTEADYLRPEWFTAADRIGDNGTALRQARLGQLFEFGTYKDLNMANVATGNTVRSFAVNNAAGYGVGATAITVDTGTGEITPGTWVDIGGMPYQVASRTGTAPTTAVVLSYGLKRAVADNDVVTVYTPGAVNNGPGYAVRWSKQITVDGFSVAPRVGQLVSFGADTTNLYGIIQVSGTTGIVLDRGLDAAIADDATVNIGPAGAYNLAFNRNAITLAIRGLNPVMSGAGALSATRNLNGLSMRVVISYDAVAQKHRWTFDFLSGIQVIDKKQGAVLLG